MNKYGCLTKFTTKKNQRDPFTSILLEAAEHISAKGLLHYIIYKDIKNDTSVFVTEIWDSKTDHENSLKGEENKAIIAKALPLLDGKAEITELDVLGGTGI